MGRVFASQTIITPVLAFPFAGAAVDLDFANGRYWNGTISTIDPTAFLVISRSTPAVATSIDASGVVQNFAANTLRVTTAGLLIEEARTNIELQSQGAFNNTSFWGKPPGVASISDNSVVAPDGTTTASSITYTNDGLSHGSTIFAVTPPTTVTSTIYTGSVFLKASTQRYACVTLTSSNTANHYFCAVVDLQTGTITQTGSAGSSSTSSSITALANGWYRLQLTANLGAITDGDVQTGIAPAATGNIFDTFGTISWVLTGSVMLIWGVQLEQASLASSYIPTTTGTVTRAADNITSSGAGNAGLIDTTWRGAQGSAVIFCNKQANVGGGANRFIADANTQSYLFASTNSFASMTRNDGGVVANSTNPFYDSATAIHRVGGSWSGTVLSCVVDGATVGNSGETDGTLASPTQIGNTAALTRPINGNMQRLALWSTRQTDAVLQGFTLGGV